MDTTKLRAWWSHRQGLDGSLAGRTASEILQKTGWARSVGGAAPYLTLFARGGIGREAVDAAVVRQEIHELPSARGCTYVVPACDYALALKVAQPFFGEMPTALKLGVTDAEIDRLCAAVIEALDLGPLDPEELRGRVGDAARSLGEAGRKKGLSNTLPVALGRLQAEGEIRRIPLNRRLDQQRYKYALWQPNPLRKFQHSAEEAATELARRLFSWIGPATSAEFQWFSGLGVKAAKAAIAPLQLVPCAKESDRLMLPEDLPAFEAFKTPKQARYVLAGSLDGISHLRRDVKSLLAEADLKQQIQLEKGLQECGGLTDLPAHAIFDRGRLVGLWEYDVETQAIAWMSFGIRDTALEKAVKLAETYVREQLGDARSFSRDSPKSRAPRIHALRQAGQTP